jgi:hypothetical protein
MTPFGKGLLLGMAAAALMLSMKHSGAGGWWIVATIFGVAVVFTAIPDEWIRRG